MTKNRAVPRRGVKAEMVHIFTSRPGEVINIADVVNETGLTHKQVRSGVNNLRYEHKVRGKGIGGDIDVLAQGHSWRYVPNRAEKKAREKRLFEEVSTTRAGTIIVQDYEGSLYALKELDI